MKKKLLDVGAQARSSTPAEMVVRVKADQLKRRAVIDKAGIPRQ